jgi:hypothetical protein
MIKLWIRVSGHFQKTLTRYHLCTTRARPVHVHASISPLPQTYKIKKREQGTLNHSLVFHSGLRILNFARKCPSLAQLVQRIRLL